MDTAWEEERAALERARENAAAGRENAKTTERLVKAADRLRKQLAAAERENSTLRAEKAGRRVIASSESDSDEEGASGATIARLRRELETAESERAAALAMGARHESQLEEATRTVSADQAWL